MEKRNFALLGDVLYSGEDMALKSCPGHYLVCEDGRVAGLWPELPEKYAGIPVQNTKGALIIPGLCDIHLHAPQYALCGLGMDMELLDWLDTTVFPEEAKYAELAYAQKAYPIFVDALKRGATTRAVVFGTAHTAATLHLMDLFEQSGLAAMVGRVNMDRNASPALQEKSAEASLAATRDWLAKAADKSYARTRPILTPRFIPSCSDELMAGLAALQRETGLGVQSHLSENAGEVAWVKELCPEAETYADAYLSRGLFGGTGCPTIMAHCVYSEGREEQLLKDQGVWVAHCPISNSCLSSGVAPVRRFLQRGIRVGLGSDVSGGYKLSMLGVMADAVKDSKLRWRLLDDSLPPLTMPEALYLATRGGGSFFGQVGAFEPGWAFDALVLDEAALPTPLTLTPAQRLERVMYLGGDDQVAQK